MSWCRAISAAVLVHLVLLVLFTFTFRGTSSMYKVDLFFLGSILRPQEVAGHERGAAPGAADTRDAGVDPAVGKRFSSWTRAMAVDKPDAFRSAVLEVQAEAFRFVGEPVVLEDQDFFAGRPDNDMPAQAPVKMRLERR